LDLNIYPEEIVAIVGGSGCGKTTLLRSILMLLQPTDGSVKVFGTNVTDCSRAQAYQVRRRWGVMFQHSALFSSLSVLQNVMFPLREFSDLSYTSQREMALLKIALSGLPVSAAYKFPAELSGGMQKRAALARAMALDPELLFLDEPTAGLDPSSASAFDELIMHLRTSMGLTVVMVTHDLDTLARVTDRVAFLGEGKVLACEPIQTLVKHDHPLIQSYFSSARGQARIKAMAEEEA